jgi:Domain of unknown function (DUF4136)
LVAGAMLIGLAGCRKDPLKALSSEESRVYITRYDSTVDFSSYQTFRIADSVTVISNGQFAGQASTFFDKSIITALTQAMVQRGYQLQTDVAKRPDIGINISRITSESTGVINYGNYWGGYGNYWDPFYWGYGGFGYNFPYAFGTYTIREGALSMDMLDLKNPNTSSSQLNTIWTGLARGAGIFNSNNSVSMVQELFNQSPYLRP